MSPRPRGFAALSPEKRREISTLGGIAAHRAGTAHEFSRTEAIAAGHKGGLTTKARRHAGARLDAREPGGVYVDSPHDTLDEDPADFTDSEPPEEA